jgi:restriction system protein
LIERVSRGAYRITQRGFEALSERPEGLDSKYLMKFPEFADFIMRSNKTKSVGSSGSVDGSSTSAQSAPTQLDMTPLESIFNGHELIRKSLAQELLDRVHQKDPGFFERLVVDLLVAMGYGGAYGEAIQAMGQTGDGGIDGIIKEDRLGLDFIYVQAKRWQNTVGRPELQQFAGSLMGRKAAKGVFITTSGFSQTAKDFVASIQTRIVLVDGEMLANLMIDHGVGVSDQQVIHIRKLDEDYFEES